MSLVLGKGLEEAQHRAVGLSTHPMGSLGLGLSAAGWVQSWGFLLLLSLLVVIQFLSNIMLVRLPGRLAQLLWAGSLQ